MDEPKIKAYRAALGTFLTGVTVVTIVDDQQRPLGFTANSFTSVSLEPPLVLICMSKASSNFRQYLNTPGFTINILAEHQREISTTFASRSDDRFRGVGWRHGETGSPIIDEVAAWFDCRTHEVIDAGDHIILLGLVVDYDHNPSPPLGYLRGNYVHFALEQQAAAVMENPQMKTCVGAIIEHQGRILLLESENGLTLPHAEHLGRVGEVNSLNNRLVSLGLSASTLYLFAVFEHKRKQTSNIYYRGEIPEFNQPAEGRFYPFDEIPFHRIEDEALQSMLRRYIQERALDAFGIYVGDEYSGVIEILSKN